MRMLLYVGPAHRRDSVLDFSAPIIRSAATDITLVTGGGASNEPSLYEALEHLALPPDVHTTLRAFPDDGHIAILKEVDSQPYDLVILGRLQQPGMRMIHGQRSKLIAQALDLSVLRVDGLMRPVRRILLASGGDQYSINCMHIVTNLAMSLNAKVTVFHVFSQQSLVFDGLPQEEELVESFLRSGEPEAVALKGVTTTLQAHGVAAHVRSRAGLIVETVLNEARTGTYDLLVIGAHQTRNSAESVLLEDISSALLDLSPLPVLVSRWNNAATIV